MILPTVSLEDSGVLKVLFAHFAGKSYLVHYMYHCLVFSQSFTINKSLSTFNAQVFIWDEIWVIIVSRPCVLIQSELFVENFVTQVAREGFCCKSVVPLIMACKVVGRDFFSAFRTGGVHGRSHRSKLKYFSYDPYPQEVKVQTKKVEPTFARKKYFENLSR